MIGETFEEELSPIPFDELRLEGIIAKCFLLSLLILCVTAAYWTLTGSVHPPWEERPLRTVLASLFFIIAPGLAWGEPFGFRCGSATDTLAYSFGLSLILNAFAAFSIFCFHKNIYWWITFVQVGTFIGLVMTWNILRKRKSQFLTPLIMFWRVPVLNLLGIFLLILISIIISTILYNWGDSPLSVAKEIGLHASFARRYADFPILAFNNTGVFPGIIPANLFHLYEFIAAGISRVANADILPVYLRLRWMNWPLGLVGIAYLIRRLFTRQPQNTAIFWATVFLMLTGYIFYNAPQAISYMDESWRGGFREMGTSHHADSAMDMVLPLLMGAGIAALRRKSWRDRLFFIGLLFVALLWHVREFFQVGIFLGVVMMTMFIAKEWDFPTNGRTLAISSFPVMAGFAIILPISLCSILFSQGKGGGGGYDIAGELFRKWDTLSNFQFEHLWPGHFFNFAVFEGDRTFILWPIFVLCSLSLCVLAWRGTREELIFSLVFFMMWLVTGAWDASRQIIKIATFSEIWIAWPRNIYLLAYILVGAGLWRVAGLLKRSRRWHECFATHVRRYLAPLCALLIAGLISMGLASAGEHKFEQTWAGLMDLMVVFSVFSAAIRLWPESKQKTRYLFLATGLVLSIIGWQGSFILTAPFTYLGYCLLIRISNNRGNNCRIGKGSGIQGLVFVVLLVTITIPVIKPGLAKILAPSKRDIATIWKDDNFYGINPRLRYFLQANMKPGKTIYVDPLGRHFLPLFSPHFVAILPAGGVDNVHIDDHERAAARNGDNPLFNPEVASGRSPTANSVKKEMDRLDAEYLLIGNVYFHAYEQLLEHNARDFESVFCHNKMMLIKVADGNMTKKYKTTVMEIAR